MGPCGRLQTLVWEQVEQDLWATRVGATRMRNVRSYKFELEKVGGVIKL